MMKIFVCLLFLSGMLLVSGCFSTRPLSPTEKSSIKTIYMESNYSGFIEFFGPTGSPTQIYGTPFLDPLLSKIKSYLTDKKYRVTDNPHGADTRLVIQPHKGFVDGRPAEGIGFFVKNNDTYAFAWLSILLIDSKTGEVKAFAEKLSVVQITDLQYQVSAWSKASSEEVDLMMRELIRAGFSAFYVSANRTHL
ncbi:MAG: hypothetical protein HOO88_03450 [Kiritimatiellaceae bacterium]|nr:hypothetical protein [Kiritimatiellaceae bacterium]